MLDGIALQTIPNCLSDTAPFSLFRLCTRKLSSEVVTVLWLHKFQWCISRRMTRIAVWRQVKMAVLTILWCSTNKPAAAVRDCHLSLARSLAADRSIDATLTLGPFSKCALTSCTAVNLALFFAHFHFPCFVSSFFFDFCRFLSLFRNFYLRLLFELFHCISGFFSQYILHIHCTSSNRQTYKKMSTIVFRFDLLCAMYVVQMHEKILLSHIASHMWILCFCCRFVIVSESKNIPISVNTLNNSLFLLARRFCRRIDSKNIYGTDTKSTESFILLLEWLLCACFCLP